MEGIKGFMAGDGSISLENIKKIIPYREPFLFIGKIIFLNNEEIIAERELNPNEDFFRGHFADFPVMPGVLLIEGLGQAAIILLKHNLETSGEKYEEMDFLLYGIREAKFLKPVFPGEKIKYAVQIIAHDDKRAIFSGKVIKSENCIVPNINSDKTNIFNFSEKSEIAAEVFFTLAITDKSKFRLNLK